MHACTRAGSTQGAKWPHLTASQQTTWLLLGSGLDVAVDSGACNHLVFCGVE
jgi:hypothetical protein